MKLQTSPRLNIITSLTCNAVGSSTSAAVSRPMPPPKMTTLGDDLMATLMRRGDHLGEITELKTHEEIKITKEQGSVPPEILR